MRYKGISEIRVYRVDREGWCVRQRVVVLVFKFRCVRYRQVSLSNKDLRNGLAAVGAEDTTHVDPYWHRLITQLAWFELRLFNCCDGGFIEGFTMGVQELNVCRDAVGVNYHGQYGHALNCFRGYARRVWNINGTQQPGR